MELFVENPEISRDFYVEVLGFTETVVLHKDLIWIAHGDFEILLKKGNAHKAKDYQTASHGLVLYTDDLEAEKQALLKRGLEFKGFDGSEKCLTFTDPDGHWLQLVNPNDH